MSCVYDVANYILQKRGEMTTLKLQKLAFYCQAYSLAWDGEPLFDEEFQAWANGPVCPELFQSHKGRFRVCEDAYAGYNAVFSEDAIETMNAIIDAYGEKTANWLKDMTHDELPWQEARRGCAPGEPSATIITKESMQAYYGQKS